ncbi:MAG: type II toxin-antitoxin system VapC family toxin [Acidobacteria bacterium]|nr:MAG: type II toxin-antitoxin system VapC family toxin [Acidobacteriota bacterium]
MILLDTNIVSAVMAPSPPRKVVGWLNTQESATLYLSTISLAEIGYGLRVLPEGKRRRSLEERFEEFVARAFDQRILNFDQSAAQIYGEVMAHRRKIGRPFGISDGQIVSIARARRFAVATRNVRDFVECGVEVINPFELTE